MKGVSSGFFVCLFFVYVFCFVFVLQLYIFFLSSDVVKEQSFSCKPHALGR